MRFVDDGNRINKKEVVYQMTDGLQLSKQADAIKAWNDNRLKALAQSLDFEGDHLSQDEFEKFGVLLPQVQSEPRYVAISPSDLEYLSKIKLGDEDDLKEAVAKFGPFGKDVANGFPIVKEWEEIQRLKLAQWLFDCLLTDPRLAMKFVDEFEFKEGDDYFLGFVLKHPEPLRTSFLPRIRFPIGAPDPMTACHRALALLVDNSLRVWSVLHEFRFDPDTVSFSRGAGIYESSAGAFWELLASLAISTRFPTVCPICGDLVHRQRVSRTFCKRAACRKAAQRLREKDEQYSLTKLL